MATSKELRTSQPHGQKREPEDDLEGEQRLTKRFNLLNLGKTCFAFPAGFTQRDSDHIGKLYIPVQKPPQPVRRSRSNAISDSMNVDEMRDKIFIHNLDEELADISSDDEKLVFLPDIERRLTKIPHSVLASEPPSKTGNEVILYSVPSSITVPKEQDNVRKAIIESRQRARDHALEAEQARQKDMEGNTQSMDAVNASLSNYDDSDPMDLS